MHDAFCALIEESATGLQAYARALCRNADSADDLVQDALLRAWSNRSQFHGGTNFRAWLFTILRNRFHDLRRHDRLGHAYAGAISLNKSAEPPRQEAFAFLGETARVFWRLSPQHQQVLMLVAVDGFGYAEAATKIGCPVGTVRSRLSRARNELADLLAEPNAIRVARKRTRPGGLRRHSSRMATQPGRGRWNAAMTETGPQRLRAVLR